MSDYLLASVALLVMAGVVIGMLFRRSLLANAVSIFLIAYPLAAWALASTFFLYQRGLAPTISRHNTVVLLSSNPVYGNASIAFHLLLGVFLLAAGTYFGIRRLREWRNAA